MEILEKYVRRGCRTASRVWGDTAYVMLMPRNSSDLKPKAFGLSPNGTLIWKLLEEKSKVDEVVDRFAKAKGIDRESATEEVVKFIQKLAAQEVVEILDNPGE